MLQELGCTINLASSQFGPRRRATSPRSYHLEACRTARHRSGMQVLLLLPPLTSYQGHSRLQHREVTLARKAKLFKELPSAETGANQPLPAPDTLSAAQLSPRHRAAPPPRVSSLHPGHAANTSPGSGTARSKCPSHPGQAPQPLQGEAQAPLPAHTPALPGSPCPPCPWRS